MQLINQLKEKRNEIHRIAKLYGVVKLCLFGSVVREEDNENSDVDFLVEFEEGRTLFDLIRLKQDLESLLNKPVDVVTEKSLHPLLREKIEIEAVQI
ncbi:nucleotidyltransferase family protein [Alkaliphilus serpentinus]|uniref:Nucleotidyltransferase family protein n=1 Tax=Alkaliphilus serpentinus TaxID=1482731 RepID=A0A833HNB3_9FIRM|nr:nucleotidyltransferase family protein [Alkaliphilus serpentinus]KAB3529394.1 nucleotidyltransferase family protein [Alkaliphilus serpentinus]